MVGSWVYLSRTFEITALNNIVWKQGMGIRPVIFHYIHFCIRKFLPIAGSCVPFLMLISLDFTYCTLETVFQFIHFLLKTGISLYFSNNREPTLHVLFAKYRSGQFSNAALMNCDHFLLSAEVDLLLRCTWLWCWAEHAEWAQKLTFILIYLLNIGNLS
jgi:hypothetical protein